MDAYGRCARWSPRCRCAVARVCTDVGLLFIGVSASLAKPSADRPLATVVDYGQQPVGSLPPLFALALES